LTRIDLEELESLIYQRKYFVLYAPRQTGKTSCLLVLCDYLNARGEFYAVYANVEEGQASRNNVEEVNRNVVCVIARGTSRVVGTGMPSALRCELEKKKQPLICWVVIWTVYANRSIVLCCFSSMKSMPWWEMLW
jgi:hypothetical protein